MAAKKLHSIVAANVLIVLLCDDSDSAEITMCTLASLTVMATDSAVIMLSVITTYTVMCTLLSY